MNLNRMFHVVRLLWLPALLVFLAACTLPLQASRCGGESPLPMPEGLPDGCTQALLVAGEGSWLFREDRVCAVHRQGDRWVRAFGPFPAAIGRNGFAPPGEKREGDGRTPSGTYRLAYAFGYAGSVSTKMPYRQALEDDLWVDDPDAPDYNRWVRRRETSAASCERMKRDDDLYRYGVVIDYNTDPVVRGRGSAIFLHVWRGARSNTAGCVAVSEANILKILAWLDPAASPVIVINPGGR
ncbi:MAG TPA: L,D-transpeptidase family protein [Syntrophales bacterium]|nr:L,D-transpeptidase family protein [Syntrophales bacterium]HQN77151.1 L,D-transpeptidase family protein [Syntrophales bacterium]HQQ25982.1 L,D-transpeptidase family protein [Syntrophales bacterium]